MVVQMTRLNMRDYNKPSAGFLVHGRLLPKFESKKWTYTEEHFAESYFKDYEDDEIDESYTREKGKAVFFYYDNHDCIGQIRLRSNWNGYALVEDIRVQKDSRHQGIGSRLLQAAVEWAKRNHFAGLVLETQDVNLSACRFYAKHRFVIGSVDTMLYSNFSTAGEVAILWYYKF